MRPLFLCTFVTAAALSDALQRWSEQPAILNRYQLQTVDSAAEFLEFVDRQPHQIDCLVLQDTADLSEIFDRLQQQATLLPAVVLRTHSTAAALPLYLNATRNLEASALDQLEAAIEQAVSKFLALTAEPPTDPEISPSAAIAATSSLLLQQRRLAEKLQERLGYLGLYYKRNPKNFLNHLNSAERQAFLAQLKLDYREIVLQYFADSRDLNQQIDLFVNQVFFADVPVAAIVELHMELMDEFSKQLKLEGRSDEVLLDYRLTLIDTLAHLCEMYRRSVPKT